jgi:hypothetical protein
MWEIWDVPLDELLAKGVVEEDDVEEEDAAGVGIGP